MSTSLGRPIADNSTKYIPFTRLTVLAILFGMLTCVVIAFLLGMVRGFEDSSHVLTPCAQPVSPDACGHSANDEHCHVAQVRPETVSL